MTDNVFFSSSNGDRWSLGRDVDAGAAHVMHYANVPSGGAVTRIEIADFLGGGPARPEQHALLRLLGDLASDPTQGQVEQRPTLAHLRGATENEVTRALQGAGVALPITTEYEALELFHCMLDVLTDQRDNDEAADSVRIAVGFGSTH